MEGKGLLKVMLPWFWLLMQTGSTLLGRSPASAGGRGQARSLGQRAWSRSTGADAARSAVSGSPGARAGCSGPMSGLGLCCAAVRAGFAVPGIHVVCFCLQRTTRAVGAEGTRAAGFCLPRAAPRRGGPAVLAAGSTLQSGISVGSACWHRCSRFLSVGMCLAPENVAMA